MTHVETLRMLIYEPSFRRIEPQLGEWSGDLEPLLVDGDGRVSASGQAIDALRADPEIGWASPEVFMEGCLPSFMQVVLASSRMRWLQSGAAGYDHPLLKEALGRGITLTRNPAPATSIAEYVFATVLDHFEGGPGRRAAQASHSWSPRSFRELAGSTWLLVGFGAIGQGVARRAQAFEATVVAVNRSGGSHPWTDELHSADRLQDLLPRADVVVLAVPLTADTQGLVDSRFLARMKPGSVLVNVARGPIVDEGALLEALDRGTPAHAILDVFAEEPLPPGSVFWTHPRVTLTSHLAGMGSGLLARSDAVFLENLRRYLAGEPLAGSVALA